MFSESILLDKYICIIILDHLTTYKAKSYEHARLSVIFKSAKQGRHEARNATGHQVCLAREVKLPGKETPKTTRKTCYWRRVTNLTTDDNG